MSVSFSHMAAVVISPELDRNGSTSNRRVPLASNPNAANSPYRTLAAAATKRSRCETETQDDLFRDQPPPSKRQAVDIVQTRPRTPTRRPPVQLPEGRVFNKKAANSQQTSFERKLYALKEKNAQQRTERQEKAAVESLNGIKQWQKHYRRVFPEFVFYFESVPADARAKCSKQIRALGAREEKFFSKDVTHVVTTRTIPAENDLISPTEIITSSLNTANPQPASQLRVANPRSLDHGQPPLTRSKYITEPNSSKKPVLSSFRDVEPRKQSMGNADFLSRAKEMGMKIWQLEKLQRVTSTMFDTPTESQAQYGRNSRTMVNPVLPKAPKEADLSRMLRNEMINGPSDRDSSMISTEMIPFKGPHIYIRDMDEKTKPIMVKDYPKVARSEKGEWPQFRCVSAGKCPFVEEADPGKLDSERTKIRDNQTAAKAGAQPAPKTRAATATVKKSQDRPAENFPNAKQKQPLGESRWGPNLAVPAVENMANDLFCAPPPFIKRGRSPLKGTKNVSVTAGPRLFCGEPAASGLQHSNVTSAIRSQMISSTAAAPGAKAGTSKEFQELKRKVLERNSGPVPSNLQASRKIDETLIVSRAGNRTMIATRARSKIQETLDLINEDLAPSEDEDIWRADEVTRVEKSIPKNTERKERKPGYCENCRDKYDDFDKHILERKHRKFALTPDNWKELDRLLVHLRRPLKDDAANDF